MKDELLDDFQASITSEKMVQASFGKRFLATGVDGVIFVGIFMIFYYPFFESSKYQASIGKKILSIKVVDEAGGRLTFGWAFARFLAKGISFILVFVGFIMIAFTDKRGMHDIMTDTYVVKNKKE